MIPYHDSASLWSLSSTELAKQCQALAESASTDLEPALKDEVSRLSAGWREVQRISDSDYDERARKASLQAGLRKRTIEILVKIGKRS